MSVRQTAAEFSLWQRLVVTLATPMRVSFDVQSTRLAQERAVHVGREWGV